MVRNMHTACMVKIAFIGAGSVEFTRNVVTDLCSFSALHGELELSLQDIDAQRLGYAVALAHRISEQSGVDAKITSSADRLSVIGGADYVVNQIQVGGYRATRADFDIPARYGSSCPTGAPRPRRPRHGSSGWGETPLAVQDEIDYAGNACA